jgi:hypothetical protein
MVLLVVVQKRQLFRVSREKTFKDCILVLIRQNVHFWLKLTLFASTASEKSLVGSLAPSPSSHPSPSPTPPGSGWHRPKGGFPGWELCEVKVFYYAISGFRQNSSQLITEWDHNLTLLAQEFAWSQSSEHRKRYWGIWIQNFQIREVFGVEVERVNHVFE